MQVDSRSYSMSYTTQREKLCATSFCTLHNAMPSFSNSSLNNFTYIITATDFSLPTSGGAYLVEVSEEGSMCILAYLDLYGRAFTTAVALTAPPAREPDMLIAPYEDSETLVAESQNYVYVSEEWGFRREVARCEQVENTWRIFDSWYHFGRDGENLSLLEALGRAYLAFVYRPQMGACEIPARGFAYVTDCLQEDRVLGGMRALVNLIDEAKHDVAFRPPALVSCFVRWLHEAGLEDLAEKGIEDNALRLVYTANHAETYYLCMAGEGPLVPERKLWALESVFNRYLLVKEALGEHASQALESECCAQHMKLIESVGAQVPDTTFSAAIPQGEKQGEWNTRCTLALMIERLRLPVRVDVAFRVDISAKVVAFEVISPDEDLMPLQYWTGCEDGSEGFWADVALNDRKDQALRYALRIGLILSSSAFAINSVIERVEVGIHSFISKDERELLPKHQQSASIFDMPALVNVCFDRATFEGFDGLNEALVGDPHKPYRECGAQFGAVGIRAFSTLAASPLNDERRNLPEVGEVMLSAELSKALGGKTSADMRIYYDGICRHMAEGLADRIVRAESVTEAIHFVRDAQEEAFRQEDVRAAHACMRLMTALTDDRIDRYDQNAIVGRFLDEDRCLMAYGRARTLSESSLDEAVRLLVDSINETSVLNSFIDDDDTVYRTFDSYISRVLYNRACLTGEHVSFRAAADGGKRVELLPDSYYLCHLEIVRLLENSFEHAEEALFYGRRALEIAPTTAAGYRQLGRTYMLVGDTENAQRILCEGLNVAIQPSDIAMIYYQLGYVVWKAGKTLLGVACYAKSLFISPVFAVQATLELEELLEETGAFIPSQEQVDEELQSANIPLAPKSEVLRVLLDGAAAATDANMFVAARNMLTLYLRHCPDDALTAVLRTLEAVAPRQYQEV